MKLLAALLLLSLWPGAKAPKRQTIPLHLEASYGDSPFELEGKYVPLPSGDSIQFETFRFYMSGIRLYSHDSLIWEESNSFHLVDFAIPPSLNLGLSDVPQRPFDKIGFNLGIDSITNVSGVFGGDLDPTKGMYWAWQSGYINMKLEGKSNLCNTRNHEFQFHLGGYMKPFASVQKVELNVQKGKEIVLHADLEKFIKGLDLSRQNQVMSPGKEAVQLSEKTAQMFSIQAP